MNLERLIRSVNCLVNLKAEHYWVHIHVVELWPFSTYSMKKKFLLMNFITWSQTGTTLFPPLHNCSYLQTHSLRGWLMCRTVQWAVKCKEQREHKFCLQGRRDKNMVWWTHQSQWGWGRASGFNEGGSKLQSLTWDTQNPALKKPKQLCANKWLEEHDKTTGQELQQLKTYRIENHFTEGFFLTSYFHYSIGRLFE